MSTTQIGRQAEEAACRYLSQNGYVVVDRNWRTKTCEIDIVAVMGQTVSFIEVKYRSSLRQGSGFEYITQFKLKRMRYAARLWVVKHQWPGQICLGAAFVYGLRLQVSLIEQI